MKTRTIIMMLTLLVAGLAIGCSSAPEQIFSEQEAIAIARSYEKNSEKPRPCFDSEGQNQRDYEFTDVRHTASATFKANGIWLVTTKTSYNYERRNKSLPADSGSYELDCVYLVDDSTGKVRPN